MQSRSLRRHIKKHAAKCAAQRCKDSKNQAQENYHKKVTL
jgi:hypothetical protein